MTAPDNTLPGSRPDVIRAVSTPLGFFSLVVLVVEAILGVVAATGAGTERTITIGVMLVVIIGLVGIVSYFAYHRPEALSGQRYKEDERVDARLLTAPLTAEVQRLTSDNERLRTELTTMNSVRSQILGVLGAESADSGKLFNRLIGLDDPGGRAAIMNALGKLVEDGTIEQDGSRSEGYYRVRKAK